MMALMESNPKVVMVDDLLKRNQITPVEIESISGHDVAQWFFSPRPLKRCLDCVKLHIVEEKTEGSLRVRLDKGLGRQSRAYNVPAQFIMYEPWAYVRLTDDEVRIQQIVDTARQMPLHVWLQVTNGVVPGFNPLTGTFRHRFHWAINAQGQMALAEAVFDVSEVGRLQEVTSLKELFARLPQLREWPWYWSTLSWGISGESVTEKNASILLQSVTDLWR
ncbi:MAG: hypothetical protein M1294_13680 [Firmicutes bacterium]|jgi:hypothetical protein|nr:hypothetical protein [Bacillota bacterium]MCL5015555.1 hypothetical protein [Bacillota bacterium]